MKFIYIALIICLIFCTSSSAKTADFTVTKLVAGDIYTYDKHHLNELMSILKAARINTVTLPVAWSIIEPEPEQYDFEPYTAALDLFIEQDFNLILILDSSGRQLIHQEHRLTGDIAVPEWLVQQYPDAVTSDFTGNQGFGGRNAQQRYVYPYDLDYYDDQHLAALERFYHHAIDFFQQRYGEKMLAFVPGINQELEIKYGQHGYVWQGYSEKAQQGFKQWLEERGKTPAALPVMDYSSHIMHGAPKLEPDYFEFMRYREDRVKQYACRLTGFIREHGAIAAGYFGQPLSTHDAIYALGVIEEVIDCFDKITVDYNYYDGWKTDLKPYVIPLLVNYANQLGYPRVMAGLYLERLYGSDGRLNVDYLQTVRHTLELLRNQPLAGVEIGNLRFEDLNYLPTLPLHDLAAPPASPVANSRARFKIGLVASKWTYYLWHGEHSNERNIMQDALVESYRLLRHADDFDVDVLGERTLLNRDLSQYDALVFAHQTTLSDDAMEVIDHYADNGGRLVQDVRFNAFAATGQLNNSWENERFGIAGLSWHHRTQRFIYDNRRIILPKQRKMYFTYAAMSAAPGYQLRMPAFPRTDIGLIVRGPRTLVFGFLPQLIEDKAKKDFWQRAYLESIRALLNDQ